MWFLQLMGLVIVVGVVAGLTWRVIEDWLERRAAAKLAEVEELPSLDEVINPPAKQFVAQPTDTTNKLN